MGNVVNLKRFKKRVERDVSAKQADANRTRFGRTKSERALDELRASRAKDVLDQHRIDGGGRAMKSPVVKRSIVVAGHKTSVSLEEAFWNGMKEISGLRDMTLSELVGEIDSNRQQGNLSSAIRLFVLDYFRTRASSASTAAVAPAPDSRPQS